MFQEVRQTLAADLRVISGMEEDVFEQWPDRFNAPGLLVVPSLVGSYISIAQPPIGGCFDVNMDVIVIVERSDSITELEALDRLVEGVLAQSVDWAFRGVDRPDLININNVDYPATVVHLAKQVQLY